MSSTDKMSLKAFWNAVEQRLADLSADGLRSILRAMAQETLPMQRRAFLKALEPVAGTEAMAQAAMQQDKLLADIDDLGSEIQSAADQSEPWEDDYEHEWDDYGDYGDEDSVGPFETFVEPLSALFDRVEAVFDSGNLELARIAYQKLFEILSLEDNYGRGIRLNDVEGVDGDEVVARYLRAIYETESPKHRPQVLFAQMQQVRPSQPIAHVTLGDISDISTKPLPDRDRFLRDWIEFLHKQSGGEADAWLREAIRLSQGAAGLEKLARAEGKKHPRAYLDWFTALEQENKYGQVLTAAQEALEKLPDKLPIRAAVADRLCAAAAKVKDATALRAGRWHAFAAQPTLPRLLDVRDATPSGNERAAVMQQAILHIKNYLAHPPRQQGTWGGWREDNLEDEAWIDKSVLTHAYLLAGDWEAAHQLAAREKTLGWSSGDNPQGLVVACFFALLSGQPVDALPKNLTQLWQQALQTSVGYHSYSYDYADYDDNDGYDDDGDDDSDDDGDGRADAQEKDTPRRLMQAYAETFAATVLTDEQQLRVLSWCTKIAKQRMDDIVSNLHRRSYGKAAQLIAACAEVWQARGQTDKAEAMLNGARESYPRHRAFQSELDTAMERMGRSVRRKRR